MLVISEHLIGGCGPPEDQRTQTDGMALLLIPEGGLHSSRDSFQCLHFIIEILSLPKIPVLHKRCIGFTDNRFITHPSQNKFSQSTATAGNHLTRK